MRRDDEHEHVPVRGARAETALRWLLRVVGASGLLAVVFVIAPGSWLDAIHRRLGLGPLPDAPIVGYLARSLSAFYAIVGGLLLALSRDPIRHRPLLLYMGAATAALGVALVGIDLAEGLPAWWTYGEGPFTVALGLVIAELARRLPAGPGQRRAVE